ncbi:hypothetical protein PHMEG_0005378 [Phytophthora megakarya]|uniref:Reverse transcriptase domain-containing protein n=1 Tax=Phytophthora megakarya TaxID=4795 RepID=A0A225WT13_9STRA|nr:hypothetical protein PHMEG_0005378 [Phytophthora megakarya]
MPVIDDILDVLGNAKLFSTMDIASVYPYDCVVVSNDFPTHLIRLKQVFERFRKVGFNLKMKKCKWSRDQVTFLGHEVTP